MLEVVNLTKVYKGKKGTEARALDGVTLSFPEKGMVFLLGKSGSGKSTLLNLCGGLDSPTSGEIIVKGRSSKSFSQSDFDSYRNTYVGFIFQEYNILNDFSVEDNIALALELQGKPKKRKDIEALLEEVDLSGYGKRRPNTLSGGQKQRIAIARALVKSPEIIMADEPTGALDSNTGKQVLDTLKKLSRDKLVIVVSHDREFAEQYGDRIIELKDGKVISDISKTHVSSTQITENINEIDDVLSVKKGSKLSDDDFERIKSFLMTSEEDVIIAKNTKDVSNFKKVSGINEDGEKEVFKDTDIESLVKKEYSAKDGKFIRSKLPLRHAVRIGVSGMRKKPFRLTLTVLLCTVAFVLFGLLSTLSFYSNEATFKETLPNGNVSILSLEKLYKVKETYYENGSELFAFENVSNTSFGNGDIEKLRAEFGKDIFGGVDVYTSYNSRNTSSNYWKSEITAMAYLPEGNSLRGSDKLVGEYPDKDNEIAISSYAADMLYECKVFSNTGVEIALKSPEDIIGKSLSIEGVDYTVVGIVDSGEIDERFEVLKTSDDVDYGIMQEYDSFLTDGIHLMTFVSKDRLEQVYRMGYHDFSSMISEADYRNAKVAIYIPNIDNNMNDGYDVRYLSHSEGAKNKDIVYLDGKSKTPSNKEVIVPENLFYTLVNIASTEQIDALVLSGQNIEGTPYQEMLNISGMLITNATWDESTGEPVELSKDQRNAYRTELIALVKQTGIAGELELQLTNPEDGALLGEIKRFTVIGLYDSGNENLGIEYLIINDALKDEFWSMQKSKISFYTEYSTDYVAPTDAMYSRLYLPYGGTDAETDALWNIYSNENFGEDGSKITVTSSFVDQLKLVDGVVETLSKVFLYVGIALALFAALLFSNFISTSISYKKREIGILRAVGARSFDVFKIFFSESVVISVICLALSTVGSIVICSVINAELSAGIGVSLFVFGPLSFAVLAAIATVTAFVATFLPVYKAAKKKPVDSIRSM